MAIKTVGKGCVYKNYGCDDFGGLAPGGAASYLRDKVHKNKFWEGAPKILGCVDKEITLASVLISLCKNVAITIFYKSA